MAKTDKPNNLIIWGDDIGWYNISAYNHGVMGYRTLNIDRVAEEGARSLTDTASKAVQPVGQPSSPDSLRSVPV